VALETGRITARVQPKKGEFAVRTVLGTVKVVGTEFVVQLEGGEEMIRVTCGVVIAAAIAACAVPARAAEVTVTIDPTVRYQTIRGWSCNPHYLGMSPRQRDQALDDAVNELGLTRLRWQQPNGNRVSMRRWEWENDNGDPAHTDFSNFNTAPVDQFVAAYVLPFKKRIEANGDPFELWLSPSFFDRGSTGPVPAWLLHNPGEYAEYATSFILYLKNKHGIETTHYAICNEAGNHNAFKPAVVAQMTKTLGARMKALGLGTRGQFSDGINARVTWRYIQAAKSDPEVWKYVDLLTYHWYGGNNQEFMPKIRDFALAKGMETGQTEFMRLTMNHLYDDLTLGGVSYWSIYGLGGPAARQNYYFHLNGTSFSRGRQFWNFRQVMHYVRPGAVRVKAASGDHALRALAFVRDGRTTAVLINKAPLPRRRRGGRRPRPPACSVTVNGLSPGRYGVCQCVRDRPYQELGVRTVTGTHALTVQAPSDAVVTIYPHPGRNQAPTVTLWEAKPNYLTAPASTTTLSASAQDPERDALSYSWSVTSQPQGANAALADPTSATARATGLAVPGEYVFSVTVRDATHRVRRDVALRVFRGNQAPMLIDVHNRIPVLITLPWSATELRGGAKDLEGDKLTYRWTVAKQPKGAAVRLETPTQQKCKVSHITAAGDHVFQFEVSDGTHTVSQQLTVPVYPMNAGPVIGRAAASPNTLKPPASRTSLTARTSDPDGDVISHWWSVRRSPAGARPVLARPGARDTTVTGLTVPGTYLFRLTVVDRTRFAAKDVLVTVGAKRPAGKKQGAGKGQTSQDPPAKRSRDDRVIIARGTVVGTVVNKGRAWIQIRSDSGKTHRYIPPWRGGSPRDGGGPDKQIVAAIRKLKAGNRVRVKWYVNDHLRIADIGPAH